MPPSQKTPKVKDSIERRRARGEISCAECRLHKVKCDKAIPCSTCVRKGCESICPNGTTPSGHGSRSNATNSDALYAKLAAMSKRIRELENALYVTQDPVSADLNRPHAKSPSQAKDSAATISPKCEFEDDSLRALAVTNDGKKAYLGCPNIARLLVVACSYGGHPRDNPPFEVKMQLRPSEAPLRPDLSEPLLVPVSWNSEAFPFTTLHLPADQAQAYIEEKLPSYARASALVEAYLGNLSWFFQPVDRAQIMEELIPAVYLKRRQSPGVSQRTPSPNGTSEYAPVDPHILALLLAVFAAGAAADLTLPPWNDEAEAYYHLARMALGIRPVFEGAELHTVQAVALIGAYDLFACRKDDLDVSWKILSFSSSLAASLGLNRDPTHFKHPPKLVQRRRRFFWELQSLEVCKSVCTGWPLTFTSDIIDCQYPEEADAKIGEDGVPVSVSVWWFRYRLIKEVMTDVVTKLGAVVSVKYSEILALDERIREFNPRGIFGLVPQEHDPEYGQRLATQVQISLLKDLTLLLLHRDFFIRALVENPRDPLRTQFGPSFLSSFRSAMSLLSTIREQIQKNCTNFLMRLWPIWAHALSASVILGSIAVCSCPHEIASQAYSEFNLAFEMFTELQVHPLVKSGLPILARLRDKAVQALSRYANESPTNHMPPLACSGNEAESNVLSTIKKGIEGEYAHRPPMEDTLYGWDAYSASASSSQQYSMPLNNEMASHPVQGVAPTALEMKPGSPESQMRESPGHSPADSFYYHRSEHYSDTDSETTSTLASAFAVDMSPTISTAHTYPQPPPHAELPSAAYSFSPYSDVPSASSSSCLSSNHGVSYPEQQERLLSTLDPRCLTTGSSTYGSPPGFLAPTNFDPDFDVGFDMRPPLGQENILPLLPHDMDVWRTLLQDSRFFGNINASPEEGRSTVL